MMTKSRLKALIKRTMMVDAAVLRKKMVVAQRKKTVKHGEIE